MYSNYRDLSAGWSFLPFEQLRPEILNNKETQLPIILIPCTRKCGINLILALIIYKVQKYCNYAPEVFFCNIMLVFSNKAGVMLS